MQLLEQFNAVDIAFKQLANLSGGELQKVFLARALVNNPNLLILDEPTTGLDHKSEIHILNYLKKLNENYLTSIFMVTHNFETAEHYSNKLLVLNKAVMFCGDTEEGMKNDFINKYICHCEAATLYNHS